MKYEEESKELIMGKLMKKWFEKPFHGVSLSKVH